MDEEIIKKAEAYVARRDCHLAGWLGFGIHGIVFAIEGNAHPGVAALKIHYAEEIGVARHFLTGVTAFPRACDYRCHLQMGFTRR